MERIRKIIQEAAIAAISPEEFPHFKEYAGLPISEVPSNILIPWLGKHGHEFVHQKRVALIKQELIKRKDVPNITTSNYANFTKEELALFFNVFLDKRNRTLSKEIEDVADAVLNNLDKVNEKLEMHFGDFQGQLASEVPHDYLENWIKRYFANSTPDAKQALTQSPDTFFLNDRFRLYYTAKHILKTTPRKSTGLSEHIGKIGDKIKTVMTVERKAFDQRHKQHMLVGKIKTNTVIGITKELWGKEIQVGEKFTLSGKISSHKIFRDEKYTVVRITDL
jgi:hypothetical protein|tara:strand:+ start:5684 stop:6520 length:837 start_codon:yes stop_codon:yes gene_type:complete